MRPTPLWLLSGLLLAFSPTATLAQPPAASAPAAKPSLDALQLPAPDRPPQQSSAEALTHVEQMPEFPGGPPAMFQMLARTADYPTEALRQRQEGRVFVSFVVGPTGAVQEAQVVKHRYALLDAEAVRAVLALPDFAPGRQNGQPKAVRLTVPITFRLPDNLEHLLAERAEYEKRESGQAEFVGGPAALRTYLSEVPLPAGYQPGPLPATPEVFVSFQVDTTGQVKQVAALRSLPQDEQRRLRQHPQEFVTSAALLAEAERWVGAMPAWTPARLDGKPIEMYYMVPVSFVGGPYPSPAYAYADQMPVLPDASDIGMLVSKRVWYPARAIRERTQGVVLAYYEVSEEGRIENIKIIRSVTPDIDNEIRRVLAKIPVVYQPAQHRGKPTRVFYVSPFKFAIK